MQIKGFSKGNMNPAGELHPKQVKSENSAAPFMEKLQQVEKKQWQGKLDQLLDKIQSQGKVLAKTRNLKELKKYKSLVKNFMEEAVDSSLELKQNSCWNQRGKHRVLVLVETVDKRVEELTELLLTAESKTLDILDKLDEIRGLLIDMYT